MPRVFLCYRPNYEWWAFLSLIPTIKSCINCHAARSWAKKQYVDRLIFDHFCMSILYRRLWHIISFLQGLSPFCSGETTTTHKGYWCTHTAYGICYDRVHTHLPPRSALHLLRLFSVANTAIASTGNQTLDSCRSGRFISICSWWETFSFSWRNPVEDRVNSLEVFFSFWYLLPSEICRNN